MSVFTAACLQVNAGREIAPNIETAAALIGEARAAGADLVLMPENVSMMEWGRANIQGKAMAEGDHTALAAFRDLAREHGIWLHSGTLAVKGPGGMVCNRSHLIAPDGRVVAHYDKIHMFDVDLGDGESYRESATFQPGDRAVVAHTPWGGLGLSICYDLRFPHLYRSLAQAGASFLAVPAAFTRTTGRAHWHVLLRARAIETGCWVFAPAQCGEHVEGRQTYGHALIVDPWGEVVADAGDRPGIILAEIDTERVALARRKVPCLRHDRPFGLPVDGA
ncbi:MAG: carbon-nitrogen hydrolase family protein [Alphaproteobacteria bacterium]|nr:carbon-nitrogen hydrolase family protein [Alphaproteobacteria bacterium]